MIGPLHIEVALAAGYAGFLLVVAAGLEWFGRHSHRRSGQFRTAGFKYHNSPLSANERAIMRRILGLADFPATEEQ